MLCVGDNDDDEYDDDKMIMTRPMLSYQILIEQAGDDDSNAKMHHYCMRA